MLHEARRLLTAAMVVGCAMTMVACSGGNDSKNKDREFSVGGTLSGLGSGLTVTLLNNGANALAVNANGSFTFTTALAGGAAYAVTVGTQPIGQTCTVANGSGTVGSANVTNVAVTCVNVASTYTIGGTVSGLGSGLSLTLLNSGGNALLVNANGSFTFSTALASGAAYAVTVGTQPAGQTCTVTNGAGTVASANVTNVSVSCSGGPVSYSVGGTVSGLGAGLSVTLLNNGGNSLVVNANGSFSFSTALASGAAYAVTVGTQPTGQTCTVANGTGNVASVNVTNVAVTCSSNTYTVGGTVSGLGSGLSVTLLNNGGNSLLVNGNGSFTFSTALASGAAYSVTVGTQPTGQSCSVTNGTGTVASANVTNVSVTCSNNTYTSWKSGSNLVAPAGVYGTLGVPAATNAPGGRNWNGSWTVGTRYLWIFGGQGYDSAGVGSVLNDLWRYDSETGIWTWMGGSTTINATGVYGTRGVANAANIPGAREFVTTWTDSAGHFWLFGGFGFDGVGSLGYLNDLWMYNPTTGLWTWMDGPNAVDTSGVYGSQGVEAAGNYPGARWGAVSWNVGDGYIWVFGGYGVDANGIALGYLNDLWRFNPANGRWTWMSGSNLYGAPGIYGTKGVPDANNVPGARNYMVAVVPNIYSRELWLFGGAFEAGGSALAYNDLWTYSTLTGQWTWVSGVDAAGAPGIYGTKGVPAATNAPGARAGAIAWVNTLYGEIWIFGGAGYDSVGNNSTDLNDLWRYDHGTGQWTWMSGSNLAGAMGVYGTLGTPSVTTQPGARDSGTAWRGPGGHFWLFGGAGYDSQGIYDSYGLNDVFEYIP